ncbi:energy-coupling factor ABC transporter ATP-binding protein [Pullulanibacillus sp. KACC 23026]|uniref:energy-coupling factor ABC transporter ATP-binding protein n=1 Tax=Pullulanibacillus sp. KACC 23026 TaxID=3028315 RepID=UPI0023B06ADA|nr:energy-coupling factor ABC transporter ATP-binding protein [Pullulanibacillus sp. KACC 23026]WEG12643.1 energy-coupling factor ABC transporter ATP-binding protein [Pullulanibacillus sp. KACC 23026]
MDIKISSLSHVYHPRSPFERVALEDISVMISSGSFVSIIGHTGSGKSTLIQHMNGLLKPTKGSIVIGDARIESGSKAKELKQLRKRIGMVFQYPEHQLFEETVEKDICFGPLNFGMTLEEAQKRAREVLELVGLPEKILTRSPFELSGGQMRRVAIAGVLASNPEAIILDEPTAGLDPRGREEMMSLFSTLNREQGLTTIMVTHSMDDAAYYSDQVLVMDQGKLVMSGPPTDIFKNKETLRSLGLDIPKTMAFLERLSQKWGDDQVLTTLFSVEETSRHLASFLKKKEGV